MHCSGRRRIPLRGLGATAILGLVATAAAPGWLPVQIRPGDTLWALARAHHTTVAAIRAQNHLTGSLIYAGRLLSLPTGAVPGAAPPMELAPAAAVPANTGSGTGPTVYVVRVGDNLTRIAARFHTSLATLAVLNHLPSSLQVDIGQRLHLPTGPSGTAGAASTGSSAVPPRTPTPADTPTQPAVSPPVDPYLARVQADTVALAARPIPTPVAAAQLVVATAQQLGVPAELALGIADQESGFQQQAVSWSDAVGVMQLEPATTTWLSSVAGRTLDRLNAADNIYGGVLLLHLLLSDTGRSKAIAGYYQGLGSVLTQGMYPDTKIYVADVLALAARFRRNGGSAT